MSYKAKDKGCSIRKVMMENPSGERRFDMTAKKDLARTYVTLNVSIYGNE